MPERPKGPALQNGRTVRGPVGSNPTRSASTKGPADAGPFASPDRADCERWLVYQGPCDVPSHSAPRCAAARPTCRLSCSTHRLPSWKSYGGSSGCCRTCPLQRKCSMHQPNLVVIGEVVDDGRALMPPLSARASGTRLGPVHAHAVRWQPLSLRGRTRQYPAMDLPRSACRSLFPSLPNSRRTPTSASQKLTKKAACRILLRLV